MFLTLSTEDNKIAREGLNEHGILIPGGSAQQVPTIH